MRPRSSSRRPAAALVVAAAVSLGLIACSSPAPGSSPTPSITPSAAASTAPEPTPVETAAPAAARIVLSGGDLAVLSAEGELARFDYRALTADVVAGLSEHLGEPVVELFPAGNHNGAGRKYNWNAFGLSSEDRWATASDAELPTYEPRWRVSASAPDVHGIAIESVEGFGVGDSTTDILAAHPEAGQYSELSSGPNRTDIVLDSVLPPIPVGDSVYSPDNRWSVMLSDEDPVAEIERIVAPVLNYGA